MCQEANISRQGYYKSLASKREQAEIKRHVLELAIPIRCKHSKMGCRKIYSIIKSNLLSTNVKFGRDKFIDLMVSNGLHVKTSRRRKTTTSSNHKLRMYDNLIKNLEIRSADQVWVSDITYLETLEGFMYLSLVTDLYSRQIQGYALSNDLSTIHSLEALQMAVKQSKNRGSQIHHSDRGVQYCSSQYVEELKQHKIESSMTRGGSPEENAVAERLNGILKQEYGISDKYQTKKQCKKLVTEAIDLYNNERPHLSLGMQTPKEYYNKYYRDQKPQSQKTIILN